MLFSAISFSPKSPLLIGLALAILAAVTFVVVKAATITSLEESVRLSNGQEVRLGQPTGELKTGIHKVNDQLFQYPNNRFRPIEAIIYAENNVVSAIQIIKPSSNSLALSGVKVGASALEISARLRGKLEPLEARLLSLNRRGNQVNQSRSVAYFLKPPCSTSEQVTTITLALKDYATKLAARTIPSDCNTETD